jgi:hypothetical protein
VIGRGEGQITLHRDDVLMRVLLAAARRDAARTRGALRHAATRSRAAAAGRRAFGGAPAELAPVRRELRRLGGIRAGRLA